MIANKGLLTGTLLVTFLSGSFTGYVASQSGGPQGPNPYSVDYVYAAEFDRMQASGYTETELTEARKIFSSYLEAYQVFWEQFQKGFETVLDPIETQFESQIEELDIRVRDRVSGVEDK